VVAIIGEPGVGKSRPVWEVTHSPRVHGWLALQAGWVLYGKAASYLPVIFTMKTLYGMLAANRHQCSLQGLRRGDEIE
jgi:hypothetical protein